MRSFERKLEDAQDALGMEPRNYIPVTYVTELSWLSEAAKLLPTILLIGGYIYFQRKMQGGLGMGGGGGAGGARGIFNVGKAQVSKIDKNAKDKVRVGWAAGSKYWTWASSMLGSRGKKRHLRQGPGPCKDKVLGKCEGGRTRLQTRRRSIRHQDRPCVIIEQFEDFFFVSSFVMQSSSRAGHFAA